MTLPDWEPELEHKRIVRKAWRRNGARIIAYYLVRNRFQRIWLAVEDRWKVRVHVRVGRKWVYFLHDTSGFWWGSIQLARIPRPN